ncbi:hypothetical protein Vafri_17623 [Volvox africanus]|uniref:SET domain-containing protein n=1 Tax=Volvox africanus TaxID=51714 RepID=A0A8J4BLE9_9CHLO|nr:hypothetical protein Vafri_17623 [Volvox africanus]
MGPLAHMCSTQRMGGHPASSWGTCCQGYKAVLAAQPGGRNRNAVLSSAVLYFPRPISGDRGPVLVWPAMALQMPMFTTPLRHKARSFPRQTATATAAAAPGFGCSLSPRLTSGTAGYRSTTTLSSSSGRADGCTANGSISSSGNSSTFNASASGRNRIDNYTGRQGSLAPLRLVDIPGKGRGVVATRKLNPGELLMVCRPLALVQGPAQTPVPVPQQQPAKVGARRTQQQPTSPAGAGATGSDGVGFGVPKAGASISEAALVSDLQRLEWRNPQTRVLAFLYRGVQQSESTGRSAPRRAFPVTAAAAADSAGGVILDLTDLTDPWDSGEPSASASATTPAAAMSAGPAVTGASVAQGAGLMADQLAAVVRLNATGLPSDDVLLAKLYGRPNHSFIGLWPAHAMLNHSCAPNAVAVVSGSELFIRCCAPVPAGGEVCITYSGALGLGPLPLRRALLERNHRFRCRCPRCAAEERVPRELAQLWSDIVMLASQQLQPQLMAAAAALRVSNKVGGDGNFNNATSGVSTTAASATAASATAAAAALPALLDVRGQVAKCFGLFEETLGQLSLSPQEELWMQASMYPLYETRARCAQLITRAVANATSASGASEETPSPEQDRVHVQQLEQAEPGKLPHQQQVQAQQQEEDTIELERRLSEEYLDALSLCLRLQGAANAGSDMHVQLAARYDAACAAHVARHPGPRGEQLATDARQRLERALGTRYGTGAETQFRGSSGALRTEGVDTSDTPGAVKADAITAPLTAPSLEELVVVLDELRRQQL